MIFVKYLRMLYHKRLIISNVLFSKTKDPKEKNAIKLVCRKNKGYFYTSNDGWVADEDETMNIANAKT